MLVPVAEGPALVACDSCRFPVEDGRGVGGGARMVEVLNAAQAADPAYDGIAVQAMSCLFACGTPCAVHLRAPGRIGYVLGRLSPDAQAARAILDFAVAHARSEIGEVAYRDWPEGVKGRFVVRTPPAGFVVG